MKERKTQKISVHIKIQVERAYKTEQNKNKNNKKACRLSTLKLE
jgi:hypothetical protein